MISILLSTFNSKKYLREQIDSILSQSFKDWELIIRDDGSTDGTVSIIKAYTRKHPNIKYCADMFKFLGAKESFIKLLENTTSEYYMFCDHDDVWMPNKIEITFKLLHLNEEKHPNKPILIFTDLLVVDSELRIISDSMWKFQRVNPENVKNIYYLSISNPVTGCTLMFNQRAKEISLPISQKATMHDLWIALNVSYYGIFDYIKEPTILYRQHHENVIGAKSVGFRYYLNRLYGIRATILDNIKTIQMLDSLSFKINYFKWVILKVKLMIKRN